MNENLSGHIGYFELRKIIFDYFRENYGIQLSSISIDNLKSKYSDGTFDAPFFILHNDLGESRFDISKDDVKKILGWHLASIGCELIDVDYGYGVTFKYNKNSNVTFSDDISLDIIFDGGMKYSDLRQIIFDYYKKNKGIQLGSISIDYLKQKLADKNFEPPFFIKKDDNLGEIRFDIPEAEIKEIFEKYLASKGYELLDIDYTYEVGFKYRDNNIFNSKKTETVINEKGEIIRNGNSTEEKVDESIPHFEPPVNSDSDSLKQLVRMEKEKRKFTILRRERAMSDAQKSKNRSAIFAGMCILGAAASTYFGGQDINQMIKEELNLFYSWDNVAQYLKDLGPLTTLLAASAGGFIAKYFRSSKKLKNAKQEFEDFNASLDKTDVENLGGNENARTR